MFKQFTYRQRIKILPVAIVIVLLLIYLFAIRETLKARNTCKDLAEQVRIAGDAPQQVALIRGKLEELNKVMGKDTMASGTDPLLEFITTSNADKRFNLVDYMPLHMFLHQNYQVETRVAVLEGSYTRLLKFLYHLENEFRIGKVVSVKFESEINVKINKKRLLMTLYVQSVINQEAKAKRVRSQSN